MELWAPTDNWWLRGLCLVPPAPLRGSPPGGNALNHPETMQPDMHMAGSPLPASHYYADVGGLAFSKKMIPDVSETSDLMARSDTTDGGSNWKNPKFFGTLKELGWQTQSSLSTFKGRDFFDVFWELGFFSGYLVDGTDMMWAGNLSVKVR